jgi:hypothetical protein
VQDAFAKLHYARASNEQLRVALSAVLEKHIYRFTNCACMSQVHCVCIAYSRIESKFSISHSLYLSLSFALYLLESFH